LTITLRLVGWPKALAKDWLKAARNHLEVKLALEVNSLSFSSRFRVLRELTDALFYQVAEREATAESLKAL